MTSELTTFIVDLQFAQTSRCNGLLWLQSALLQFVGHLVDVIPVVHHLVAAQFLPHVFVWVVVIIIRLHKTHAQLLEELVAT